MPDVRVAIRYTVELSGPEMLLVLKALGGRLKESEAIIAEELGDRLTQTKIKMQNSIAQSAGILQAALDEKAPRRMDAEGYKAALETVDGEQ